ncbi:MAG: hypothetical protein P8075_21385 [Deltaproteobacteria bacterium]|jgi:hypothetical protein
MKPGIMNLSKWVEKTAQAVRQICIRKQAPCVGFSLVFYDPLAEPAERWNYVIQLAYDPNNPPSSGERQRLEQAFELISEGIRRIMSEEESEDTFEDCSRASQWH